MKLRHEGDYRKKRAEEYPSVEDQLDMLWHSMHEGKAEKVEPFYSSIAAVKQRFPKSK